MQVYQPILYEVTYQRFGQRRVDHLRDKRVACALATHLARLTGALVNVYETIRTPVRTSYQRLLTTIRPK